MVLPDDVQDWDIVNAMVSLVTELVPKLGLDPAVPFGLLLPGPSTPCIQTVLAHGLLVLSGDQPRTGIRLYVQVLFFPCRSLWYGSNATIGPYSASGTWW